MPQRSMKCWKIEKYYQSSTLNNILEEDEKFGYSIQSQDELAPEKDDDSIA